MSTTSQSEHSKDRWNRIVVPTAKGIEVFFWRLAWFAVFIAVIFGAEVRRMLTAERKPDDQIRQAATLEASDVSDLRPTAESGN
jgi:hypothetical protein